MTIAAPSTSNSSAVTAAPGARSTVHQLHDQLYHHNQQRFKGSTTAPSASSPASPTMHQRQNQGTGSPLPHPFWHSAHQSAASGGGGTAAGTSSNQQATSSAPAPTRPAVQQSHRNSAGNSAILANWLARARPAAVPGAQPLAPAPAPFRSNAGLLAEYPEVAAGLAPNATYPERLAAIKTSIDVINAPIGQKPVSNIPATVTHGHASGMPRGYQPSAATFFHRVAPVTMVAVPQPTSWIPVPAAVKPQDFSPSLSHHAHHHQAAVTVLPGVSKHQEVGCLAQNTRQNS
jgi:hypothetical protein